MSTTIHFEYDPERLIEEVRKRPGIWDFDDVVYRTKSMRQKLWTDVVTELMEADVKVTKSEMRELELQLQKKWKSIRDCFQKYIMNPNRSKRPYIYTKKLQFLLKNSDLSEQRNASADTDNIKKPNIWRTKRKLKITKDSSDDENDNDTDNYNDDSKSNGSNDDVEAKVTRQSKKAKNNNGIVVDEFAFANVDSQNMIETDDCDKLFLLSLLPHLKSIPEEFRLNIKMELMHVLRNAHSNISMDHKFI